MIHRRRPPPHRKRKPPANGPPRRPPARQPPRRCPANGPPAGLRGIPTRQALPVTRPRPGMRLISGSPNRLRWCRRKCRKAIPPTPMRPQPHRPPLSRLPNRRAGVPNRRTAGSPAKSLTGAAGTPRAKIPRQRRLIRPGTEITGPVRPAAAAPAKTGEVNPFARSLTTPGLQQSRKAGRLRRHPCQRG